MRQFIFIIVVTICCVDWGQSSLIKEIPREHREKRQVTGGNAGMSRILDFLQRKNLYKVYNVNRAVEEWQRLDKSDTTNNLKKIIKILVRKSSQDYDRQNLRANPNATGNSLVFRQLLKFYTQAPTKLVKYQVFDYLSDQLQIEGNLDKMSLDDAIIFANLWIQEILNGGLIKSPSERTGWTEEIIQKHKERNVRVVVRAANRIYPEGPDPDVPLTVADWWLRQRQNSRNVYKVYHLIWAMIEGLRREGLEISTVYEAMVDEYKQAGRHLDAFELNMIDYLSYKSFGFIEHSDPDRWES